MKNLFAFIATCLMAFAAAESAPSPFLTFEKLTLAQAMDDINNGIVVDATQVKPFIFTLSAVPTAPDAYLYLILQMPNSEAFDPHSILETPHLKPAVRLQLEIRAHKQTPSPLALVNLAYSYWKYPNGDADERLEKALEYLSKAESQGNTLATHSLSLIYNEEEKIVRAHRGSESYRNGIAFLEAGRTDEAVISLRDAAQKRCTKALRMLGEIYEKGEIAPKSLAVALQCYQAAGAEDKIAIFKENLSTHQWDFSESNTYQISPDLDADSLYKKALLYDGHSPDWRSQNPASYEESAPTVMWFYEEAAKKGHPAAIKLVQDIAHGLAPLNPQPSQCQS